MFDYTKTLKFGHETALCELKAQINYYDLANALWEPLIEKVRLKYSKTSEKETRVEVAKEVNVNVTSELVQNMYKTIKTIKLAREEGVRPEVTKEG